VSNYSKNSKNHKTFFPEYEISAIEREKLLAYTDSQPEKPTPAQILARAETFYRNVYLSSAERERKFLEKQLVADYYQKKVFRMSLDSFSRENSVYKERMMRSIYLAQKAEYAGNVAIFLTFTAPSCRHPYVKNDGDPYRNVACSFSPSDVAEHRKTYENLQASWKRFRARVKRSLGFSPSFIRVAEPHHDFTPHIHAIVYIPCIYLSLLEDIFSDMHKDEIAVGNLGEQHDFEVLESASASVSYVMKYTEKGMNPKSAGGKFESIRGWSKALKIRQFSMSQMSIPMYVLRPVIRNCKQYNIDYGEGENLLGIIIEKFQKKELEYIVRKVKKEVIDDHGFEMFHFFVSPNFSGQCIGFAELPMRQFRSHLYTKIDELLILNNGEVVYDKSRFRLVDFSNFGEIVDFENAA
jgi:hypothetical protein